MTTYILLLLLLLLLPPPTTTTTILRILPIFCEDPFSSSTPYAGEELEYNVDFLIDHQDIRQCHFPGDQNRAEDRYEYEEEAYNPNEEGQHVFQSLSPD